MKSLDLFTGAGGMTLGLERAGIKTIAMCEKNNLSRKVLHKHWPDIPVFRDATKPQGMIFYVRNKLRGKRLDVLDGGDPCPCRSIAKGGKRSSVPDLSGWFLALAGSLNPRWVLRENVPAPDDTHFCAGLEALGYRTIIIRTDASTFTGQQRKRDFIIGCDNEISFKKIVSQFKDDSQTIPEHRLGFRECVPCLSAHYYRGYRRDMFVLQEEIQARGKSWEWMLYQLRCLDAQERIAFAGFPKDWFDGVLEKVGKGEHGIAVRCGNAVVPAVAQSLGEKIIAAD